MTSTHLTSEERYTLSTMRKQGHSVAYIAKALDRNRSTLYRELECILLFLEGHAYASRKI
ncbi:helix-turn-helix domain-containing protein [Teredinibacter turnerae]|uniref:helix-turn-helix domain-containing protein n=1 Tax=Teredinibacter turnerae TaxID=2426 RepID=UPI0009B7C152